MCILKGRTVPSLSPSHFIILIHIWEITIINIFQELQYLKTESLQDANYHDTDDCAKKLLCELTKKQGR